MSIRFCNLSEDEAQSLGFEPTMQFSALRQLSHWYPFLLALGGIGTRFSPSIRCNTEERAQRIIAAGHSQQETLIRLKRLAAATMPITLRELGIMLEPHKREGMGMHKALARTCGEAQGYENPSLSCWPDKAGLKAIRTSKSRQLSRDALALAKDWLKKGESI